MNCWWIFFHKWTKWANKTIPESLVKYEGQERYCLKCNKRQVIRTMVVNG